MTAKISDCKNGSRRKIKQVISGEREKEGGRDRDERIRYLQTLPFSSLAPTFPLSVTHVHMQAHKGRTVKIVK